MAQSIEVIAFDLMDTLVRDPYREALTAAVDGDLAELFARRDPDAYPAFERGEIDEATYWATYRAAGFDVDPDVFHRTRRAGYRWLSGMRELLLALRDVEVQVVVASNYPYWIRELEDDLLADLVDSVHASCDVGVRKPDACFYRRVAARLGVPTDEVLFVDDRQDNVRGAVEAGMAAVRYDGVEVVVGAIRDSGVSLKWHATSADRS